MSKPPTLKELKKQNPNIDSKVVEEALALFTQFGGHSHRYRLSIPFTKRDTTEGPQRDANKRYNQRSK